MSERVPPDDLCGNPWLRRADGRSIRICFGWAFWRPWVVVASLLATGLATGMLERPFVVPLFLAMASGTLVWQGFHVGSLLARARSAGRCFDPSSVKPAIPDDLLNSPWLRFDDEGTARLRFGRTLWWQLVGACYCAGFFLYMSRRSDTWFGPPLILGGIAALAVWQVVEVRRLLRRARSPSRRFRISLTDFFLMTTAVAIFFAGWAVNDRRRSAELVRRAEVQHAALAILGPNGKVERDHLARVWLTIGDPTFDDARLAELLDLFAYDQERYGITRLAFNVPMGARFTTAGGRLTFWPRVTDASIDRLERLEALRELSLHGTAISSRGAERLLALPNLNGFAVSDPLYEEAAAGALKAKPSLRLMDGPSWPARRLPAEPNQAPPLPPTRRASPNSLPAP